MKMKNSLGLIATIISILTGLTTLIVFFAKGLGIEKRQIKIQSVALEELTSPPRIEKFSVTYTYDSQTVDKLWRLVLVSKNTGNKPIIGNGYQSNLLNNVFQIYLGDNFKILNEQTLKNEVDAKVAIDSQKTINIRFSQWKPNESINMVLFIENTDSVNNLPTLSFNTRDLLNCSFEFRNSTEEFFVEHPITKIRRYFPDWLIMILVSFSFGAFIVGQLPLLSLCYYLVSDKINYKKWKNNYLNSFTEKINDLKIASELKEFYKNNPRKVSQEIWDEIHIPKAPSARNPVLDGISILIYIVMTLASIIAIIVYKAIFFS